MSDRYTASDELLLQAFAKLDKTALGVALGTLLGLGVFLVTNVLLLKGGPVVGPNLWLLSHFFIGYSVTVTGSLVGLVYGFATGFVMGWLIAALHNLFVAVYFYAIRLRADVASMPDYIDPDHS